MRVALDFQSGGLYSHRSIGGLLSEVPTGTRTLLLMPESRFEKHIRKGIFFSLQISSFFDNNELVSSHLKRVLDTLFNKECVTHKNSI
jgi:hypothetical protein